MKKKFFAVAMTTVLATTTLVIPNSRAVLADTDLTPAYFYDFENGLESTGTEKGSASVVGSGSIECDQWGSGPYFGKVYHNDPKGENKVRTNYLQLPDIMNTVIEAGKNEMSVGFWVNKANEDNFFYSPIFSMYNAKTADTNTWPMFILQTRLLAQVNCDGYCDFGDALNVSSGNKTNFVHTNWLDDGEWHYYTATITEDTLEIYVDGEVKNAWKVNNTDVGQVLKGLFSENAKTNLNYVCLGGNQAWDWNDADASFAYDDVAIYTSALSQEQIKSIIAEKKNYPSVYVQYKAEGDDEYTVRVVGEVALEGTFSDSANTFYKGAGFRCAKAVANMGTAKAESYVSTVVFKSLVANGVTVEAADGKYFIVTEITNVPADATFYVNPVCQLSADGTTVSFTEKNYTINMADIIKK